MKNVWPEEYDVNVCPFRRTFTSLYEVPIRPNVLLLTAESSVSVMLEASRLDIEES